MCLLVLSFRHHSEYVFAAALNRDEYLDRPTVPAGYWSDFPAVIAGRDEEKKGTWAGFTRRGRFAFVTNVRKIPLKRLNKRSRGELVSGFLTDGDSLPVQYLKSVRENVTAYNPFNLILGSVESLSYYSSESPQKIEMLRPGVHALSNHALNTPWPKLVKAKAEFEIALRDIVRPKEALLNMLMDTSVAPDNALPDTGVGLDLERKLSPIFVSFKGYGTRSSTVILVTNEGWVDFTEVTHITDESPIRRDFRFKL